MKIPRMSLQTMIFLVSFATIDCWSIRTFFVPGQLSWVTTLISPGSLPVANFLAVGLLQAVRSHGRWKAFWIGFGIAGGIAFLAWIGLLVGSPAHADRLVALAEPFWYMSQSIFYYPGSPLAEPSTRVCIDVSLEVGVISMIYSSIQILFAIVVAACIASFFKSRLDPTLLVDIDRRPIGNRWLAAAVFIVAIPWITSEWYRR